MEKEKFENLPANKKVEGDIEKAFSGALSSAASKKTTLEGDLKKQKDINDGLCKDFANKIKAFNDWLDSK